MSLVTADGAVTVIPRAAPRESTEVVVNAITVQLAVVTEEEILRVFDPIALSRGQSYAFVVLPAGRTPRVVWAQAEVASE